MKILYLCHRVPYPPDKGDKIRAYHHLAHLVKSHQVHVACLADTPGDLDHARSLEKLCASVDVAYRTTARSLFQAAVALPMGRSLSIAAFDSPELRAQVERRLEQDNPDVLVAYSAAMAQYIEGIQGRPRVLDFVDADSEKLRTYGHMRSFPQSALYALEANRLARYEGRMASLFDASIFISEAEAEIVRRSHAEREFAVIPNGVDLDAFRPRMDGAQAQDPVVVFTGAMGYYPNADAVIYFANDVFPLVKAKIPNARFVIVGRDPTSAVRRLSRPPDVTVTGFVPDVRPFLAEAAVAVAPFRMARGVQNKVLEAMASGLPVVGTTIAFQGLAAGVEDGIRIADTPDSLAGEVASLLTDAPRRLAMGQAARAFVERHHRWEVVGQTLEKMLLGLVEARRGAPR